MTDIVTRLQERFLADAFGDGRITDGRMVERLLFERADAATEIEHLRKALRAMRAAFSADMGDSFVENCRAALALSDAAPKEGER